MLNSGQQILSLFDDFQIKSVEDALRLRPGLKPVFVSRLFKTLQREIQPTLSEIKNQGGLKLHYHSDHNNRVTASSRSATFFKKTSFYANTTLVTIPFREIKDRATLSRYSRKPQSQWGQKQASKDRPLVFGNISSGNRHLGPDIPTAAKYYEIDPLLYQEFLKTVLDLKPAIKLGVACVFPILPDNKKLFNRPSLGLTPARFDSPELTRQFFEIGGTQSGRLPNGVSTLYLPYFSNVPLERVLEIREQESDIYWELQRRIENLLARSSETDSESAILEFLGEVDEGVRSVNRRYEEIQRQYRKRDIHTLIQFIATGLVMLSPIDPTAKAAIASIVGGSNTFQYWNSKIDRRFHEAQLRNDNFFLPWKIFKSQNKTS